MNLVAGARRRIAAVTDRAFRTPVERRRRSSWSFELGTRRYAYFVHPHNATWRNERTVELPLILAELATQQRGRILEVGNVLAHYVEPRHDIVDKYERGPRVQNVDIIDFTPEKGYDLIVSISTLEHVGWDEEKYEQAVRRTDPTKLKAVFEHLRSILRPGGRLVFTVPLGYNPMLDRLLETGELGLTGATYLLRVSADGRWEERPYEDVRAAAYGSPYPAANAIAVGVVEAK